MEKQAASCPEHGTTVNETFLAGNLPIQIFDPAIPLLRVYPEEIIIDAIQWQRFSNKDTYHSSLGSVK